MNRENSCCFTGPRPANLPEKGNEYSFEITKLKNALVREIKAAYGDGYRFFLSGMAEGFDLFAAEAVLSLKEQLPGISLICVLPYRDATKFHSAKIVSRMEEVTKKADAVCSLFDEHINGCELSRNRYMVDNSSMIIGFYNGLSNGTAHCWKYALEQNLKTVNIYENKLQ